MIKRFLVQIEGKFLNLIKVFTKNPTVKVYLK